MEGHLAALSSSCSLLLTFTAQLNLIFHFHISFSPPSLLQQVWCEAGAVLQGHDPQTYLSNGAFMANFSQGWHWTTIATSGGCSQGAKRPLLQSWGPPWPGEASLLWAAACSATACLCFPSEIPYVLPLNSLVCSHEKSWFWLIRIFWHFLEDSQRALKHFCSLDSGHDFWL